MYEILKERVFFLKKKNWFCQLPIIPLVNPQHHFWSLPLSTCGHSGSLRRDIGVKSSKSVKDLWLISYIKFIRLFKYFKRYFPSLKQRWS